MGAAVYGRHRAPVGRRGFSVSAPAVSIVIPTWNGAATLPAVLDAIGRQQVDFEFETIAVDSSSSDGTGDLLRRSVDRVISIPAGTFDHGLTRNIGIDQARSELVVLLVQDAEPASESWLASLTAPLLSNERIAGTFGRQLPRPDASPLTRYYLSRYVAAATAARTVTAVARHDLDLLDPEMQLDRCTFDNVCSCIRRTIWSQHPFRSTPIAEDVEWAREVLTAGYELAFAPAAAVVHSHDRSVRYEFQRTRAMHRRLYELFGLRTIPTVSGLARATASSLMVHTRCERDAGAPFPSARALGLAFAWPLGQYLGALSAARGRTAKRPTGI